MITNVRAKTAILTYDAGGSELLAAWVKRQCRREKLEVFVDGPGRKVFERRMPDFPVRKTSEIKRELKKKKFKRVITSVNWGSKIDKEVWTLCRKLEIPAIAYLEKWPILSESFLFERHYELPDQIWLSGSEGPSKTAKVILDAIGIPILKKPNYYLIDQVSRIKKLSRKMKASQPKTRLLFAAENISSAEKAMGVRPRSARGFDEWMALEYFLSLVKANKFGRSVEVLVRPHPSEKAEKYFGVVEQFSDVPVRFSAATDSLEENIAWSTSLVSYHSMALDVARLSGKEVVQLVHPLSIDLRST